jgi:hypothetical protein
LFKFFIFTKETFIKTPYVHLSFLKITYVSSYVQLLLSRLEMCAVWNMEFCSAAIFL